MKSKGLVRFLEHVFLVAAVAASYLFVYAQGIERGYWEHEGEENVYECEVLS